MWYRKGGWTDVVFPPAITNDNGDPFHGHAQRTNATVYLWEDKGFNPFPARPDLRIRNSLSISA